MVDTRNSVIFVSSLVLNLKPEYNSSMWILETCFAPPIKRSDDELVIGIQTSNVKNDIQNTDKSPFF